MDINDNINKMSLFQGNSKNNFMDVLNQNAGDVLNQNERDVLNQNERDVLNQNERDVLNQNAGDVLDSNEFEFEIGDLDNLDLGIDLGNLDLGNLDLGNLDLDNLDSDLGPTTEPDSTTESNHVSQQDKNPINTEPCSSFKDLKMNRLNNVKTMLIEDDCDSSDDLPPICVSYLKFVKKLGYTYSGSFNEFCLQMARQFLHMTEKEINDKINEHNKNVKVPSYDDDNLDVISYHVLLYYLKYYRNIDLTEKELNLFFNEPMEFFDKISFTFRKATFQEMQQIRKDYKESWYKDYILPLFSLTKDNTPLLLEMMKNGTFDENEAVEYTDSIEKFSSYLVSKSNGKFDKGAFDVVSNSEDGLLLYKELSPILSSSDLIESLNGRKDIENIIELIKDFYTKYHGKEFSLTKIKFGNKTVETFDYEKILREHAGDLYLEYLLKGINNGIFCEKLYMSIIESSNKRVLLGILNSYSTNIFIEEFYDVFNLIGLSIFLADVAKYGYDRDKITNDIIKNRNDESLIRNYKELEKMSIIYHSGVFMHFSENDYKQWLALICQDYILYTNFIFTMEIDYTNFNRFWAVSLCKYFNVKSNNVDKDVKRNIRFISRNAEIYLPFDYFIYTINNFKNVLKDFSIDEVNCAYYDSVNKILTLGSVNKSISFLPNNIIKTSLDCIGEDDISKIPHANRTELIQHYNLFYTKRILLGLCRKNVRPLTQEESLRHDYIAFHGFSNDPNDIFEKEYNKEHFKVYSKNFDMLSKLLLDVDILLYIRYDACLNYMRVQDNAYALIMVVPDPNVVFKCIESLKNYCRESSDSLYIFSQFITNLFKKTPDVLERKCTSKFIRVINDTRFSEIHPGPVEFKVFMQYITYFSKLANEVNIKLSYDRDNGGICITLCPQ